MRCRRSRSVRTQLPGRAGPPRAAPGASPRRRVPQDQAPVVQVPRVLDCGGDAHIRADAHDDQIFNPVQPQHQVQLGAEERVIPALRSDDQVGWLRSQAVRDLDPGAALDAVDGLEEALDAEVPAPWPAQAQPTGGAATCTSSTVGRAAASAARTASPTSGRRSTPMASAPNPRAIATRSTLRSPMSRPPL